MKKSQSYQYENKNYNNISNFVKIDNKIYQKSDIYKKYPYKKICLEFCNKSFK